MDHRRAFRSWIKDNTWISGPVLAVLLVASGGCATGSRPTLAEESSTGYPEVDAVLGQIGQLSTAQYSGRYDVLLRFGNVTTAVSASQSDGDRRSLTIGDVRYVVHGSITKTCTVSTGSCIGSIDPARVSDVQMTPDFFGTSLIARLRLDASRSIGPAVTTTEDIQGESATCVAIPITDATTTYCVFDNGVLARLDAPDLVVTMTGYSPEVDETLYSEGGTTTTTTSTTTTTTAATSTSAATDAVAGDATSATTQVPAPTVQA